MYLRLAALFAILLCSCARISIYSDETFSGKETGIKFYTPKPYLLVARTGAKEKPTEVSVIWIPDLSKPLYAKLETGFGASELTMSFSNGILTAVGQKNDPKIAELLNAIGGANSAFATASKTRKEASLLQPQAGTVYKAAGDLKIIADDLKAHLTEARDKGLLTKLELQALEGIVQTLSEASTLLTGPTAEGNLPAVLVNLSMALKQWDIVKLPESGTDPRKSKLLNNIAVLRGQVEAVQTSLAPKPADEPSFSLYEIDNSNGLTSLREVKF
ncbi:hypothetical protein AWB80_08286 [Caballeronia pedi]|uniref:Lipoprotein n=1 Tax=Caballeronia pedi TaxID=1777141 RepID=A0A158E5Z2_9BURK|nr:hypothetical protein [Caballeronia pedi]SAL02140.1 hypothetical protein AWB80_08286 [Caballeronia pedi]